MPTEDALRAAGRRPACRSSRGGGPAAAGSRTPPPVPVRRWGIPAERLCRRRGRSGSARCRPHPGRADRCAGGRTPRNTHRGGWLRAGRRCARRSTANRPRAPLFDAESHARAVQGPEPPLHGGIVVRRPVFRGVALRPLRRPFPPGVGIPFRGRSLPHVAPDAFRLRRPSRGRAERPRQQEDEQQRGQPFHRASALEYSENSQPKRSTIMLSISSAFSARFTMLRRISSSEASVMSDRWMR